MHLEEPKENAGNDLQYNLCYKNNNNNKLLAKLPDLDILIFFFPNESNSAGSFYWQAVRSRFEVAFSFRGRLYEMFARFVT